MFIDSYIDYSSCGFFARNFTYFLKKSLFRMQHIAMFADDLNITSIRHNKCFIDDKNGSPTLNYYL